jgi:hypothetical protein
MMLVRLWYFAVCGVKFQGNLFGPPGIDSLVQQLSIGTHFAPEFSANAWGNGIALDMVPASMRVISS